jgi:hypothetical protein
MQEVGNRLVKQPTQSMDIKTLNLSFLTKEYGPVLHLYWAEPLISPISARQTYYPG